MKQTSKPIMPHYFLKLNPCRPTFAMDMTDDERAIMQQHVAYWGDLMNKGRVVVYGPVINVIKLRKKTKKLLISNTEF